MGLLDTLSRQGSPLTKSAGVPAAGLLPTLGATISATGLQISQATAISVSTVYACVMTRAKDVARCRPRLLLEGAPKADPVTDHPIARLLKRPNWVQTWLEFVLQMQVAYLLRQNAYAAILRNGGGEPVALIPINPDAVTVLEAADGSIFYQANRVGLFQMAALRGMPLAIPAEDMFHLRGLTFNMLVGIGALAAARVRGVRVPDDISVISLDGEDAIFTAPPLTAIATPLAEMGARAVVELEAMIDGREPQDVVIDIPPKLIYRESVAGPPNE